MLISVLIPCFNEKKTIEEIVDRINNLKNINIEIIIIDDCSNDGTVEILKNKIRDKVSKIIFNESNFGKGYSLKKGIELAKGEIILIQDADLEYDPNEYFKLTKPIIDGNADVVYGSRFIGGMKEEFFFWHTIANKLLTYKYVNQS